MRRGLIGGLFVSLAAAVCIAVTVDAQQPAGPRGSIYLVQLAGPVLDVWKGAIAEAGAELQDYVPPFGFHARMTPAVAARLRRLAFVSSVDALRPDHKFARGLRRNGSRPYVLRLENGADSRAIQDALRAAGAQVLARGNAHLMIVADSAQLDRLVGIDGVQSIDNYVPRIKHNEYGGGVIMGSAAANANGFDGSSQTVAIADTGLGLGTAADAHPSIAPARVHAILNWPGVPDFCFQSILNDGAQDVDTGHGTHVATAAVGAGNGSGLGRGTAPAASLVFQSIENYAVPSLLCNLVYGLTDAYYLVGIPDNIGDLFTQAYGQGARIHSDSWGAEVAGEYNADAANADAFVWSHRDMAITFSAGNSGVDGDADGIVDEGSINSPGTAKNVITVGASENDRQSHWECDPSLTYTTCAADGGQNTIFSYGSAWPDRYPANPLRDDPSAGNAEQMAAFSSRGPTTDGRIKPDVVAPGTWNLSGYSTAFQQQYDAAPNPVDGAYQYDGWGFPADAFYKYLGGTSMAAPLVAGGAAVVRDFYEKSRAHQASAALVKAVLINSAVDLLDENNDGVFDNAYPIPNMHEGWGRVDLVNATDASDAFFDETVPLSTGTSTTFTFDVTSPGVPLKATLAWTDYPASTSAATTLVNDLDLTVVAPDGTTTYTGNVFAGGWSVIGGSADRLNNVENVYVFSAMPGTWTITVSGYNVPQGPQPFALVIDTESAGSGLPRVRVSADDSTATEAGQTPGVLRFSRSGDTASALEVAYTISGTATAGSDYSALSGFVTIPEGAVDATVTVSPVDDALYELPESVIVTTLETPAYTVSSPSSASVTIVSDDLPPDLTVSTLSAPAAAGAGATISVSSTTKNLASGSAGPSRTAFYLSTNASFSADDVFLTDRAIGTLGNGAADASTTAIVLPATTAPATYYLFAKADWTNAVDESNEANNLRASLAIKVGPDLIVSAVSAPSTAAAGDPITVTDTTKNQGAGTAGATTTAFYLSPNTTLDATDVPLGARAVNALGVNATHAAMTTVVIPAATAVGSYYVLAQADSGAIVPEYLETNNVKATAVVRVGADLSVTALAAPANAGAGSVITVTETTTNIGGADSPDSVTRYYLSPNTTLDAGDTILTSRAVPAIDAGVSSGATVQLTIPPATATGSYYLIADADDDHEIAETVETNNGKNVAIKIGPDLTISAVASPDAAAAGSTLTITDSTQNLGGGASAATQTSFYLSTNTTFDAGDLLLGVRDVPALSAGQVSSVNTDLTIPASVANGRYYVVAKADSASAVIEVLETNNTRAGGGMNIGPDLLLTAFGATSTVTRGVAFAVTDTTRNSGSEAPATTTRYYLSTNSVLDDLDIPLGSRTVVALSAGGSNNGQVSVVIPVTQAAGTYYIIAKADAANAVVEASEANNTLSRSLKVQ